MSVRASRSTVLIPLLLVLASASPGKTVAAVIPPVAAEASLARAFPSPPVLARSAVVMDAENGTVLTSVNPHLRLAMASTTKIMTGLMAYELGRLADRITVPAAAFNYEADATVMGLHPGQVVSLKDLLYGLFLPSGADAANTIAIHYAGTESRFVRMMNREAALLGMHDTHYVDATGLSAGNHFSSAYDLALLGQYVSYLPELATIVATRSYKWNGRTLQNINKVMFWYPGVDGIKPGFTDAAGICQVLDARRDNHHVVVTLLNTPNLDTDSRNLLNFGLRDFSWSKSPLPGDRPSVEQRGTDSSGAYDYFPAAGHYLRGGFMAAYTRFGGFPVLGLPRTESLAEDSYRVQYFQNGALRTNAAGGQITRVPLGARVLPLARKRPSGQPRLLLQAGRSSQSLPSTAPQFKSYVQHHSWLGQPLEPATLVSGDLVQVFTFGALVAVSGKVSVLPVGDRFLNARHFLPAHPGNAYPAAFAAPSVMNAIGWL